MAAGATVTDAGAAPKGFAVTGRRDTGSDSWQSGHDGDDSTCCRKVGWRFPPLQTLRLLPNLIAVSS